jgi:hypothetical protein
MHVGMLLLHYIIGNPDCCTGRTLRREGFQRFERRVVVIRRVDLVTPDSKNRLHFLLAATIVA